MPQQRWAWTHKYAVPMFLASVASVVVTGLGLLAVVNLDWDGGSDPGGGGPGLDDCVFGQWQVVTYSESTELGTAEMVEGEPVFSFEEDGTGRADFGAGMLMEAEVFGTEQESWITGHITYQYETADQAFEFVNQDSAAPFSPAPVIEIPGLGTELTLPTGPLDYTCDDDEMSITGPEQVFGYERL
jgi:hypothetical protein